MFAALNMRPNQESEPWFELACDWLGNPTRKASDSATNPQLQQTATVVARQQIQHPDGLMMISSYAVYFNCCIIINFLKSFTLKHYSFFFGD